MNLLRVAFRLVAHPSVNQVIGDVMKLFKTAIFALAVGAAAPAMAGDNYLFGFSPYGVQTLTLNGTTVLTATDTGWISDDGEHTSSNNNYIVGNCCGTQSYNDYFTFDLSNFTDTIFSAVLSAGNGNGYMAGPLSTWSLFDVNSAISSLDVTRPSGDATGLALFNDLETGSLFGSRSITSVVQNSQVDATLNGSALAALNGARGSQFALGGTLRAGDVIPGAVPEPATWAMMLMGFAGMGLSMRRSRKVGVAQIA